jgi:hypothetical protein
MMVSHGRGPARISARHQAEPLARTTALVTGEALLGQRHSLRGRVFLAARPAFPRLGYEVGEAAGRDGSAQPGH